MKRRLLATLFALSLLAGLAACGSRSDSEKVDVVVSMYPLEFLTQHVGGEYVDVRTLAKPGVEPHDLELTPRQVGDVSEAQLIVYLHGFQPAIDKAVKEYNSDRALDLSTEESKEDPHVWLDPSRMIAMARAVTQKLEEADPDHASDYSARLDALTQKLQALDAEYKEGLKTCALRSFVVSHDAFGYLGQRYDLEQIPIAGLDPEVEPSPARLAAVAELAKEKNVKVIFFERLVDPAVAKTIADQVGARTEVLDPVESVGSKSKDDYFSLMRTNLKNLRTALECT